ncbi:type VII secretion protein EssB [Streptococcus gordonii]|nr:type VII secretion protein EssB [Streptococcus gordonii]
MKANQFKINELPQYQTFLERDVHFLAGEVSEVTEEELQVTYEIEPSSIPLVNALEKLSLIDRLVLAQKMQFLSRYSQTLTVPYIHPNNLFVLGEYVKVAHRGFSTAVMPFVENEDYFKSYRALILYIINPRLDFYDLINGSSALKNPFSQEIQQAQNFAELNESLNQQVAIQVQKRLEENIYTPKNEFKIYKWGMISFGILFLVLAVVSGFYLVNTIPYKDRIISSEIYYTNHEYSKALETLEKDNPKNFPKGTQYALAVSAIKEDNLSSDQKENILKNISMKTNETILLYWIYIGFGDYEKTLDAAQNIGDNQLILYAYRKLYSHVSGDSKMKGSEKQEKLKEYKEQIKNYEELLEGKDAHEEQK